LLKNFLKELAVKIKSLVVYSLLVLVQLGHTQEGTKKIYVETNQIEITNGGILAHMDGQVRPIVGKTLSFDENGMRMERPVLAP
jgi:hypothetical protein